MADKINKPIPGKIVNTPSRKENSDGHFSKKQSDSGPRTFVSGRPPKRPTGNNPK